MDRELINMVSDERVPFPPTLDNFINNQLKGVAYKVESPAYNNADWIVYLDVWPDKGKEFTSDTLQKALLKLWMWVEFGKEWKEGGWK